MDNLGYLESIKEADKDTLKDDIDWFSHRKIVALEIIAETLMNIDDKLNSLINNGKVINVDTHEV